MGLLGRLWPWHARPPRGSEPGDGLVLLYHRIATTSLDPWRICVSPDNFEEHIRILSELGTCCRVCDLPDALNAGRPPVFAVTFDDGYADNAAVARPILTRYRVPATFFVVSEGVGSEEEFWWDAIERVFLSVGELPSRLLLTANGCGYEWDLAPLAQYSDAEFRRHAGWNAENDPPPTRRHEVFLAVWCLLRELPPVERGELVSYILEWAGLDGAARSDYRLVTRTQVAALAADEQLEVGAHTRTHPALPALPPASQVDEIAGSKCDLEAMTGRRILSFSYPFGCVSDASESAVLQSGFKTACTSRRAAVRRKDDPVHLPRVAVENCNGGAFRKMVTNFVGPA